MKKSKHKKGGLGSSAKNQQKNKRDDSTGGTE